MEKLMKMKGNVFQGFEALKNTGVGMDVLFVIFLKTIDSKLVPNYWKA